MKELLRTNDAVFISWVQAMLGSELIEVFLLDGYTSVLEGSASAIPRRLMVADEDYERARRLLTEAGEGHRLG